MGLFKVPKCFLCDEPILTVICPDCMKKHVSACINDFSPSKAKLFKKHNRLRLDFDEPDFKCFYCGREASKFLCENCFHESVQEWIQWHAPRTMEMVSKLFV